jgi:hypothetical protein
MRTLTVSSFSEMVKKVSVHGLVDVTLLQNDFVLYVAWLLNTSSINFPIERPARNVCFLGENADFRNEH